MSTFMDERVMRLVSSPSGLRHVEGWYGETLCGVWINYGYKQWGYSDLTSLRWLGKIANGGNRSGYCKRCMKNYEGMDTNAY